ncbi:MAG: histidine phosphatase family protein [Sulfitobacter sp.]
MTRLALLRHGHTEWNRTGRIQGRTDIPLDDDACAQLSGLRMPAPWEKAQLWASPLSRAVRTAQLVTGHTPLTDPALIEMNWGDWEGKVAADLHADAGTDIRHIENWGWNYTPPNGESPAALRERLVPWANALKTDAVAVCHIGVMRVLMAHATGWGFDGHAPFQIKRNRLYVINVTPQGWHMTAEPVRLIEASL